MRRVQRETNQFQAEADDGTVYTVVEWTTFSEFRPLSGSPQWVRGAREYLLSTGGDVSPLGDGAYRIVETDEIIRVAK